MASDRRITSYSGRTQHLCLSHPPFPLRPAADAPLQGQGRHGVAHRVHLPTTWHTTTLTTIADCTPPHTYTRNHQQFSDATHHVTASCTLRAPTTQPRLLLTICTGAPLPRRRGLAQPVGKDRSLQPRLDSLEAQAKAGRPRLPQTMARWRRGRRAGVGEEACEEEAETSRVVGLPYHVLLRAPPLGWPLQ